MRNEAFEAKKLEAQTAIETEVNAITPELTPEQKAKVIEIAVAHVASHSFQMPSISGIANHVRSSK